MLRHSPNHGTQRLPNDDDDEWRQKLNVCVNIFVFRFHMILTLYKHCFVSKMAANLNYLYISELSTDIFVSAFGFSWLNIMFPSTATIHLYYYQCRWHTVDINGVRCRQSALNEFN